MKSRIATTTIRKPIKLILIKAFICLSCSGKKRQDHRRPCLILSSIRLTLMGKRELVHDRSAPLDTQGPIKGATGNVSRRFTGAVIGHIVCYIAVYV
jgi:hypothetical protein